MIIAFAAGFAGLGVAWCLVAWRGEVMIALPTASAGAKDELLAVLGEIHYQFGFLADGQFRRARGVFVGFCGEVNDHRLFILGIFHVFAFRFSFGGSGVGQFPNHRATGHFDDHIFSGFAGLLCAFAVVAVFGNQARHKKLRDQIVEIVAGLKDDTAAAAAIAAIGAALGLEGFAPERYTTASAVAGAGINFYLVDKHCGIGFGAKKSEAQGLAVKWFSLAGSG